MIGAVGDDGDGQRMLENLQEAGVGDGRRVARRRSPPARRSSRWRRRGRTRSSSAPGPTTEPRSRVRVRARTRSSSRSWRSRWPSSPGSRRRCRATSPSTRRPPPLAGRGARARRSGHRQRDTSSTLRPEIARARPGRGHLRRRGRGTAGARRRGRARPSPRVTGGQRGRGGRRVLCGAHPGVRRRVAHDDALRAACAVGADAVTHAEAQPPLRPLDSYRGAHPAG